jgi:DNA-binding FadR family transcriptional regulator
VKLSIRVNRKKPESLTRQITDQLTGLIESGSLPAGSSLPSERSLAQSAGVARNVVRGSYEYLVNSGHIESEGRKGRRVRSPTSSKKTAKSSGAKSTKSAIKKGGKKSS